MNTRSNADVLLERLDLAGKDVIDVGCGEGGMVRVMTAAGAHVVGVDCSPRQLQKAHAADPAGGETYIDGVGEDLPFDDQSQDIVVFFNSLHHVPVESQETALAEAARVLRPGGTAYIAEPVAVGPQFELVRLVNDETEVRARAYEVLGRAGDHGLSAGDEFSYIFPVHHESFDQFRDRQISVDAKREALLIKYDAEIRANYDRIGVHTDDGDRFDETIRVNIFTKE